MLDTVKNLLNDNSLIISETLQSLWSGYGSIVRVVSPKTKQSYIVKQINIGEQPKSHPRGWNTSTSHQRKLKSYQVESAFYQHFVNHTHSQCRVAKMLAFDQSPTNILIVMEDLDDAGFPVRKDLADWALVKLGIKWLAQFHSQFMVTDNTRPLPYSQMWQQGGYWHLATRQDEYQAMPTSSVKQAAAKLDNALKHAKFQTLIHGDAKLANMCFNLSGDQVAMVDFQYTGKAAGVVDLAYFVGSAFNEQQLEQYHHDILNEYLNQLQQALMTNNSNIDFSELETEYRHLYPIAWADFYRFLLGWNPDSWKVNGYMESMAQLAIETV